MKLTYQDGDWISAYQILYIYIYCFVKTVSLSICRKCSLYIKSFQKDPKIYTYLSSRESNNLYKIFSHWEGTLASVNTRFLCRRFLPDIERASYIQLLIYTVTSHNQFIYKSKGETLIW